MPVIFHQIAPRCLIVADTPTNSLPQKPFHETSHTVYNQVNHKHHVYTFSGAGKTASGVIPGRNTKKQYKVQISSLQLQTHTCMCLCGIVRTFDEFSSVYFYLPSPKSQQK